MGEWRSYIGPAVLVGVAALIIETTNEPWHTALTASIAVLVTLWLSDVTRTPKG